MRIYNVKHYTAAENPWYNNDKKERSYKRLILRQNDCALKNSYIFSKNWFKTLLKNKILLTSVNKIPYRCKSAKIWRDPFIHTVPSKADLIFKGLGFDIWFDRIWFVGTSSIINVWRLMRYCRKCAGIGFKLIHISRAITHWCSSSIFSKHVKSTFE